MSIHGTVRGMANRANPAFSSGAVGIPLVAVVYAVTVGSLEHHTYVHVMSGVLWTGIDIFMALVLGPVIGSLEVEERSSVFQRFTPKMTFLMPTLAFTTIFSGILLAIRIGIFPNSNTWIALFSVASTVPALLAVGWQFEAFKDWRWWGFFLILGGGSSVYLLTTINQFAYTNTGIMIALGIVTVLTIIGFGVLMPGEVRIYLEMISKEPDPEVISTIGMRNAKLAGVQGAFQLAIVVVMVYLRWGFS